MFEVCGLNPVGEGDLATITVHVPRDSQQCIQNPPTVPVPSEHTQTVAALNGRK